MYDQTLADCLLTRFPREFVDSRYDELEKPIQVVVDKRIVRARARRAGAGRASGGAAATSPWEESEVGSGKA